MALPVLSALNLSLSSACGANCVFCPSDRGKSIKQKIMPYQLAKKIIDDAAVASPGVKIERLSYGENGDLFINKNAMEILRYAKLKIPQAVKFCSVNLQNMSEDIIRDIVGERLFDAISFNIDGFDDASFRAQKRIPIKYVNQYLSYILRMREECNSPLRVIISVLTLRHYAKAAVATLGKVPSKIHDLNDIWIDDDYKKIESAIRPLLRESDQFGRATPILWAERHTVDPSTIAHDEYPCPHLYRIVKEAFIAPDGTWYACCNDADNQLNLGNVATQSLAEIAASDKRAELVKRLADRRYGEIGPPCDTVNCCQPIAVPDFD